MLKITKNALYSSPLIYRWMMHVLAHFIHHKRYVGSCKGEILKSTNNLSVKTRVVEGGVVTFLQLHIGCHKSIERFAMKHTNPGEDAMNKLGLGEPNASIVAMHLNTKKIVKWTEVSYGEGTAKGSNK